MHRVDNKPLPQPVLYNPGIALTNDGMVCTGGLCVSDISKTEMTQISFKKINQLNNSPKIIHPCWD